MALSADPHDLLASPIRVCVRDIHLRWLNARAAETDRNVSDLIRTAIGRAIAADPCPGDNPDLWADIAAYLRSSYDESHG